MQYRVSGLGLHVFDAQCPSTTLDRTLVLKQLLMHTPTWDGCAYNVCCSKDDCNLSGWIFIIYVTMDTTLKPV